MPLGPVKMEILYITSDGTDNDASLSLLMANPQTISIDVANTDQGNVASAASVSKSGKVLTLREPVAAREYILTAFGY